MPPARDRRSRPPRCYPPGAAHPRYLCQLWAEANIEALGAGGCKTLRPIRPPRALVARALAPLPEWKRALARAALERVTRGHGTSLGLDQLANLDSAPPFVELVESVQHAALWNEVAYWQYETARACFHAPLFEPPREKPAFSAANILTPEGNPPVYAWRGRFVSDPVFSARQNAPGLRRAVLGWLTLALAQLDAGEDAAFAITQARRHERELAGAFDRATAHVFIETPTRNRRAGGKARAATYQGRDARLVAAAAAMPKALSRASKAKRLARSENLSPRHVARILARAGQ